MDDPPHNQWPSGGLPFILIFPKYLSLRLIMNGLLEQKTLLVYFPQMPKIDLWA